MFLGAVTDVGLIFVMTQHVSNRQFKWTVVEFRVDMLTSQRSVRFGIPQYMSVWKITHHVTRNKHNKIILKLY